VRQENYSRTTWAWPAGRGVRRRDANTPTHCRNLLGEGVLSASFIPVYAGLRAKNDEAGARQVASSVFSVLLLVVGVLVGLGLLGAPLLVSLIAPGFVGDARRAHGQPGAHHFSRDGGVLVLGAWCLGVLEQPPAVSCCPTRRPVVSSAVISPRCSPLTASTRRRW